MTSPTGWADRFWRFLANPAGGRAAQRIDLKKDSPQRAREGTGEKTEETGMSELSSLVPSRALCGEILPAFIR